MTDFVPYIYDNKSLFLRKNKEYISGLDNNENKEYIVQNLLTEVTFDGKNTKRKFVDKFLETEPAKQLHKTNLTRNFENYWK